MKSILIVLLQYKLEPLYLDSIPSYYKIQVALNSVLNIS